MFWDVDCAEWIGPIFIRGMPAASYLTIVRSAEDTVLKVLLEKDADSKCTAVARTSYPQILSV
jgi:hypothetical protein